MGTFAVEISDEAIEEARAARRWYDERSDVAGHRFMVELDRAIAAIREAPMRWPAHVSGTRRYQMARFPFLVVYRVQGDVVRVIAVQHGKRRPRYWRGRS